MNLYRTAFCLISIHVFTGCIMDLKMKLLGDPVESDNFTDFDLNTDESMPDIQTECETKCEDGWSPLCSGNNNWCVSSYQGNGSCCDAFSICSAYQALPGIWPSSGPYDGIVPPDFELVIEDLSGMIVPVYCQNNTGNYSCHLDCITRMGNKEYGELHGFSFSGSLCIDNICSPERTVGSCYGKMGCGETCNVAFPVWCWKYSGQ